MSTLASRPARFGLVLVLAGLATFPALLAAEESGLLDPEEEEAVTYEPDHVDKDDFDTNVNPADESVLQGFDCMDGDGDGYLTREELDRRDTCVDNAVERGMDPERRTALILTRMDADRDRKVSRREFTIWSEMQTQ